jgi:hypothetical protein
LELSTVQKNMSNIDRALRIVVGIALIGLAATNNIGLWGWIGVIPLATALIGWCPAYTLLGISSGKRGAG